FESDYRVVLMDHVGCGHSDRDAYRVSRYSNLSGYAWDLLEILGGLDVRDVVFVGHSVSAMIGLLAARLEPARFACLVMVGASPCYINDG
ncbi:alpha/beta fold hydrolase, partial [Klebsiella pneumoniae]